jgi:hypothetical protein
MVDSFCLDRHLVNSKTVETRTNRVWAEAVQALRVATCLSAKLVNGHVVSETALVA